MGGFISKSIEMMQKLKHFRHYFGFPNMIPERGLLTSMDPPEISGQPIDYSVLHITPSDC